MATLLMKINPLRRPGGKSRNAKWQRLSLAVRLERGKVCELCAEGFPIEVLDCHHVLDPTDYPEHRFNRENLVVLCKYCHAHAPPTIFMGSAAQFYDRLQPQAKKRLLSFLAASDNLTLRELAAAIEAGPLFVDMFWVNPRTGKTEGH
jgi:hypothetical protein